MTGALDVWARVLELLSGKLTTTAVDTWFSDTIPADLTANRLVLTCPSEFKKNTIETRFMSHLKEALFELFAEEFEVYLFLNDDTASIAAFLGGEAAPLDHIASTDDLGNLTFSRFIVGNNNKFAHAAAVAVSERPVSEYNPLFIYGNPGLGKTHLLYAIYHAVKKKSPNMKIVYAKGDDFANELITAIQTAKTFEFRQKYRSSNMLLIDDIQFIAGKTQTQEEFFHTFNTLHEARCQIVLTSDRPPMEMMRLDDRLKSRFEWGLLADIGPPDYETRMAIIGKKAQQLGLTLPHEVAAYIADNITSNIRQLEGTVKKLTAYRDMLGEDVNISTVIRAIKDIFKEKVESLPKPDIIIQETANFYSLSSADLKGRGRTRNTAFARQISMYLIRKLTTLSLIDIGKEYDGKTGSGMDHSSVLTAIRKIEEIIKEDAETSDIIRDITANIHSRL